MVMDIIVEYTLQNKLFKREEMVCTKTLYKYVLLESLPIKTSSCRKIQSGIQQIRKLPRTKLNSTEVSRNTQKASS